MKINLRILISSVILLCLFACNNNKIQGPKELPSEQSIVQFDKLIEALTKDLEATSYSYVLLSNKEVLSLKEVGISSEQTFPAGNISELFLSTLVLKASEEDLLSVKDYLSEYSIQGATKNSKIKDILSHTENTGAKAIKYKSENYNNAARILEQATGKEVNKLFSSQLKLKQSTLNLIDDKLEAETSLNDLIQFSNLIDNQKLFEDEYTQNMMFRPVYLASGERTPCGLGCRIDITDDRKIVWSANQSNDYASIVLKSALDSISLILVANNPIVNSAFSLDDGKVSNSPFYHAFIDLLETSDSSHISIDMYADVSKLNNQLSVMHKAGKRDVAYNLLTSYLRMYKTTQNTERYASFMEVYEKNYPNDLSPEQLFSEPLAEISHVIDYMQINRSFTLEEDAEISVFATAEFAKEMNQSPWEYDHIEMFIDLNHDKTTTFNTNENERQFRFNYDYPIVSGGAPSFEGIILAQADPSDTQYNFEIAIPFKTLFNDSAFIPTIDQPIGFDFSVGDKDIQRREGGLNWYSPEGSQPWRDASSLGSLILAKTQGRIHDSLCYSIQTNSDIVLDGKNDGQWNGIPKYETKITFVQGLEGPDDVACWLRTQWDEENLYFFIEVKDDIKFKLEKSGDYGWITTSKGDTVWMLDEAETLHAGGKISNRYISTAIPLTAGNYVLNYQTNQTHSSGRWAYERPELSFYGIALFQE